jgi:hypothetical protein
LFVLLSVVVVGIAPLEAGVIVAKIPDVEITPDMNALDLVIRVKLTERDDPYTFGGFLFEVDITGDAGAIFSGPATKPATDYLLESENGSFVGGTVQPGDRTLVEVSDVRDVALSVDAPETIMRNLAVLHLSFSGIQAGDVFNLAFDYLNPAGDPDPDKSSFFDESGAFYGIDIPDTQVFWLPGSVTVVPEPSTLVLGLLAFGCASGTVLFQRRRRRI